MIWLVDALTCARLAGSYPPSLSLRRFQLHVLSYHYYYYFWRLSFICSVVVTFKHSQMRQSTTWSNVFCLFFPTVNTFTVGKGWFYFQRNNNMHNMVWIKTAEEFCSFLFPGDICEGQTRLSPVSVMLNLYSVAMKKSCENINYPTSCDFLRPIKSHSTSLLKYSFTQVLFSNNVQQCVTNRAFLLVKVSSYVLTYSFPYRYLLKHRKALPFFSLFKS